MQKLCTLGFLFYVYILVLQILLVLACSYWGFCEMGRPHPVVFYFCVVVLIRQSEINI